MAFALVAHAAYQLFRDGDTSSGLTTTGADLLVVVCGYNPGGTVGNLTDSKGNTWTGLTAQTGISYEGARIFYAWNTGAKVGAGHTFTFGGTGSDPTICVSAWSGSQTASDPFDQQNGAGATATSLATGSITPSVANALVISGLGHDIVSGTISLTGGFTYTNTNGTDLAYAIGANNLGSSLAYLIQTSAAAANPTWTCPGGNDGMSALIASFKPAAAATTSLVMPHNPLAALVGR